MSVLPVKKSLQGNEKWGLIGNGLFKLTKIYNYSRCHLMGSLWDIDKLIPIID
jgi:hypothetical protein